MRVFITGVSPFDSRRIYLETPAEFTNQTRPVHEEASALLKALSHWRGHDAERRAENGDFFKGYELPASLASELFAHYFKGAKSWAFQEVEGLVS